MASSHDSLHLGSQSPLMASRTRRLRRLGSQAPLNTNSWLRQCSKVHCIYIQPILLYGSETWAFTRSLKIKLLLLISACVVFSGFLIHVLIMLTMKLFDYMHRFPSSAAQWRIQLWAVWAAAPPPRVVFWHFYPNGFEFLDQILLIYYTLRSTLDYKFLSNYLQFRRSYAILLSMTTQFTPYVQNTYHRPKHAGIFWHFS